METTAPAEIFDRLKELVLPYSKEMGVIMDTAVHYELCIPNHFKLNNRNYQGCYYASIFASIHSVSFSLSPHRLFPEMFAVPDSLRKNLRAGSRFDFKKLNDVQEAAVAQLLQEGFTVYKTRLCQA